jgi:hypothetical protein
MAVGNSTLRGRARAKVKTGRRFQLRPLSGCINFQLPEELQLYPDQPQKGYPQ